MSHLFHTPAKLTLFPRAPNFYVKSPGNEVVVKLFVFLPFAGLNAVIRY